MKISVNDIELFTLSAIKKQVMGYDIRATELDDDLKRRLEWVIMSRYNESLKKLKSEWDAKLSGRYASLPTDPDAYASLVFQQPDYKDREARDAENPLLNP